MNNKRKSTNLRYDNKNNFQKNNLKKVKYRNSR